MTLPLKKYPLVYVYPSPLLPSLLNYILKSPLPVHMIVCQSEDIFTRSLAAQLGKYSTQCPTLQTARSNNICGEHLSYEMKEVLNNTISPTQLQSSFTLRTYARLSSIPVIFCPTINSLRAYLAGPFIDAKLASMSAEVDLSQNNTDTKCMGQSDSGDQAKSTSQTTHYILLNCLNLHLNSAQSVSCSSEITRTLANFVDAITFVEGIAWVLDVNMPVPEETSRLCESNSVLDYNPPYEVVLPVLTPTLQASMGQNKITRNFCAEWENRFISIKDILLQWFDVKDWSSCT